MASVVANESSFNNSIKNRTLNSSTHAHFKDLDLSELNGQLTNVKKMVVQRLHQLEAWQPLVQFAEEGILQCKRLGQEFDLGQEQLKETIEELSAQEAQEKEQLATLRTELQGPAVASLMAEIDQLLKTVRSCEVATATVKEETEAQQQLLSSITAQCKQLSSTCPSLLHRTKKKMDVYSCLTRIKWKYDSPEHQVSGFISRPDKKEVIPFNLDTKASSQYFIANFLWDQLALTSSNFV